MYSGLKKMFDYILKSLTIYRPMQIHTQLQLMKTNWTVHTLFYTIQALEQGDDDSIKNCSKYEVLYFYYVL